MSNTRNREVPYVYFILEINGKLGLKTNVLKREKGPVDYKRGFRMFARPTRDEIGGEKNTYGWRFLRPFCTWSPPLRRQWLIPPRRRLCRPSFNRTTNTTSTGIITRCNQRENNETRFRPNEERLY